MSTKNHSRWLAHFIWHYRWLLLGVTAGAVILIFAASRFVPSLYESTAIVYAAGYDQNNQMVMKEGNALLLLAFLESSYLREAVTQEFKLAEHYGIDTTSAEGKAALSKEISGNIHYSRTITKSIKISVRDKNPEFAARLANGIVRLTNATKQIIVQKGTYSSLEAIKQNYHDKQMEVDSLAANLQKSKEKLVETELNLLEDRLQQKRKRIEAIRNDIREIRQKFQVHDVHQYIDRLQHLYTQTSALYHSEKAQLDTYSKLLSSKDTLLIRTMAETEGLKKQMVRLKQQKDSLTGYGKTYDDLNNELALEIELRDHLIWRINNLTTAMEPDVSSFRLNRLREMYTSEKQRLNELKRTWEEARTVYKQSLPAAYLVSPAQPEYQPAYPRTWLITGAGAFLMFFFTLVVLLIRDQITGQKP